MGICSGGKGGVEGGRIRRQNSQIHEFDRQSRVIFDNKPGSIIL